MSQIDESNSEQAGPSRNPNRLYILIAAILLVVIVGASAVLITQGVPDLFGRQEPTATLEPEPTATQVPTFTPPPTKEPIDTPPQAPETLPELSMSDTDTPTYGFESAGARPGLDWTGFFGQVQNTDGDPVEGVGVIIWYRDGQPASSLVQTDGDGNYEIRLADAPLRGSWSIQLLTGDGAPASKIFTFQTDENTEAGIQQIQVIWKEIP